MKKYLKSASLLGVIAKKNLLSQSKLSYIYLIGAFQKLDLPTLLSKENLMSNDKLLDLLHNHYSIDFLKDEPIQIINYSNINKYIEKGYFYYRTTNNDQFIATNNLLTLLSLLKTNDKSKIRLVNRKFFYRLLEQNFSHLNLTKSLCNLCFMSKSISAKNLNSKKLVFSFNICFFLMLFLFNSFFHIINNFIYFAQNITKILLFNRALLSENCVKIENKKLDLPIYTILIPLYKEPEKVRTIISNVIALDYPRNKLDVKIVIESDDESTINELNQISLEEFFHVIIVPHSTPKTKPKALNYAMKYSIGEYVVIYDAEDRPDSDQLLKVVKNFQGLPEEYVCIQSKLNFYNSEENLITRFFNIEYGIWFDYILKSLSMLNLPVPLGGTSNHFKANILRNIGFWDAYNVTEDADIGVRLYRLGYRVHVINSYTMEEAPNNLHSWIKQRSRWVKGYLQTTFVALVSGIRKNRFKFNQIFWIFLIVGMSSYGFFVFPWLLISIYVNDNFLINILWIINSIFSLFYSYFIALYFLIKKRNGLKNFQKLDYLIVILWPFYFILHSIATYIAIFELITKPFFWNKTKHGVSSFEDEKN